MVKLTTAYVERKCSETQSNKSLTKEIDKHHLQRITHLYMNDKFINAIGNFAACKNLKVIYLQNNCISKIENLHFAVNLTHLYLQHNNIMKIENLGTLRNLTKLYLGYNNISIVEGLENLENLIELHIERQRIAPGELLCFDPRTVATLSNCLKVLNVTGNKMNSLRQINDFRFLEILEVKNNSIQDIEDLTESVNALIRLRELFLQGNPVTQCYRYRENLIANSESLVNLDGKDISEICRQFMKKFKTEKLLRQIRRPSKMTLSDDITNSLNLPPAFKRSVSRAIFHQSDPKLSITVTTASGETHPQIFPAWKSASGIKGLRENRIKPRPFWKVSSRSKQSLHSPSVSSVIALPPI
ncbi:protein phosphatase 1 regulatory subunit 42 [Cephus cinctus]|uniref:Protein phosphatase 1 regulatory subunit 42 n=1 Tax=Cephus cinctus TaxID=211228 RepID=A0AAJ7CDA7_CEPCN|nr:protein phosphatase 1 regulatory subunit 42 [Cephus cinctus]